MVLNEFLDRGIVIVARTSALLFLIGVDELLCLLCREVVVDRSKDTERLRST